ncbi:MAG: hypothetical protein GVY36_04760, partial [Verrucomicrobia bacterium]|nr:hypothetical protein [Verrucomicrobiota bacterium]
MARTNNSLDQDGSIIYPEGSGIRLRRVVNQHGGKTFGGSYMVDVPAAISGKRRIRAQRKSLAEAKRFADLQYKGAKQSGESFFHLSEEDRQEIYDWLPKLKKAGITLPQAAEFALSNLVGVNAGITVAEFVKQFLVG